jgi:uncharacterized protein with HEPN domain
MSFDADTADENTRFAVMRGYEIIGEATRNLPSDLKDTNPDIPCVAWLRFATELLMRILASTTFCCPRRLGRG